MSFSSSLLFTDIFKMNLTSYWLGLSGINCFNYLSYDLWQGLSVLCFCPDVLNTNLGNDWCYRKCLVYIYIYYFILLCHDYFSISFIILFYFHCYSALSFTFPLQISFDLVLHLLCFISCLCYCIYYTFYHYLSSVIFWDENKGVPTVSLFFSYRNMRKHALFYFLFVFCWVFF